MQQKPTEVRLCNAEYVVVYVNDMVVGEVTLGHWVGDKDLMKKVEHARRLENIPRFFAGLLARLRDIHYIEDHIHNTIAAKQQSFARGLMDGLEQKSVPCHAFPGINPDIPPESTHCYKAGYDYGHNLFMIGRQIIQADRAKIDGEE